MSDPLAALNRSVSLSSASQDIHFLAKCILATRGRHDEMLKMLDDAPSVRARDVLKAGVVGQSLTSASALAPYRQLAEGFVGSLGLQSAFAKIWNAGDFMRVPLRTRIAVASTAGVSGHAVSELAAKPLSADSFSSATLETNKTVSFIVVTDELARFEGQAATLRIGNELRRSAALAADEKFLALMAATSGITTAASTGTTASQILADLTARLQAMTIGADSKLWWIVSPKLYKALSLVQGTGGFLMEGGMIGDQISVAASDAATTTATLIDASQIACEIDNITLDVAREAALQLDDAPTSSPQPAVSLFQANLTALRSELTFGAVATRSTALTLLTGYAA